MLESTSVHDGSSFQKLTDLFWPSHTGQLAKMGKPRTTLKRSQEFCAYLKDGTTGNERRDENEQVLNSDRRLDKRRVKVGR